MSGFFQAGAAEHFPEAEVFATARTHDQARPLLKRWLSWASRCRLEPFKRLGRTITKHLPGVLNGFEPGKHNRPCRSDESSTSGGTCRRPWLSPRRQLHRHGLPRRWETHPFARTSRRSLQAPSTRNDINPHCGDDDNLVECWSSRASYNGNTLASQARAEGSIPFARSIHFRVSGRIKWTPEWRQNCLGFRLLLRLH